jgi:hypothetical protein
MSQDGMSTKKTRPRKPFRIVATVVIIWMARTAQEYEALRKIMRKQMVLVLSGFAGQGHSTK